MLNTTERVEDEEKHSKVRGARSNVEEVYRRGERDFSGRDLDGLSLAMLTLEGVNLAKASLRRCELAHANLSRADLSGADLREADCNDVALAGANLSGAELANANFEAAKLSAAKLESVKADGASFKGADLAESRPTSGARASRTPTSDRQRRADPRPALLVQRLARRAAPGRRGLELASPLPHRRAGSLAKGHRARLWSACRARFRVEPL